MRKHFLLTLGCLLVVSQTLAQFTITTRGKLVLKEGTKTYVVGMEQGDFEKKFGPPDRRSSHNRKTYLHYATDGLEVCINENGIVEYFTLFAQANSEYKRANVRTDRGITANSSARQIEKAFGVPTDRQDFEYTSSTHIMYKIGEDVLQFSFSKGPLKTISLVHRSE